MIKKIISIWTLAALLIAVGFTGCKKEDPATTPTLSRVQVLNITTTSATAAAYISDDGGAKVTARGVFWSLKNNQTLDSIANITKIEGGTGTGEFSVDITGLTTGVTYWIRGYATNSEGTSYTVGESFITAALPTVTTTAASSITLSSANSGGNVTASGNSTILARGVVFSRTTMPTVDANDGKVVNTGSTGSFTSAMTSLQANTRYYVRAYATNVAGTSYGAEINFLTLDVPAVTTTAITSITTNSASTGGNVTFAGNATVTERGIVYATTANPTTTAALGKIPVGSGTGSFTVALSNLSTNTTYHVRAYAINSQGVAYGANTTFTTSGTLATVTTAAVSAITSTTATGGGNVTANGNPAITAKGIVWSTSAGPTVALSTKTSDGTGTGAYVSNMTGLLPGTTYYVRAYATNTTGTAYGAEVSFTTAPVAPTVTTAAITNILDVSADGGGDVTSSGGATVTARGIVWSTTTGATITVNDGITSDGTGTGAFVSSLTGLSATTTYYVRAYATNSVGTSYGNEVSFTTASK